ncbi:MAG: glycerol-3-phosphate acyltransferase PlsX [Gammaproteobacteria bacterium]|nr:MAG: glycerol-3-phosphate acyltransferase PlsX [Gammaproteobacteria bacterium]TND06856.1 MAG: glycerol-3-phosphate acyltransferase PlsX [Gammaproteobacteria bacterium]
MGGDFGAPVVVPAALHVLDEQPELSLVLVGDQAVLLQELAARRREPGDRLTIHHASQRVEMDEAPSAALRGKKDSSMRVAINLVKERAVDACVSAGNTGALMATARYVLKTLPGIDRPAICAVMPTITGHTHMLDLGANVDLSADHLFQLAVMGAELTAAVDNKPRPTVGLLNIGEEEIKGNDQVKRAAQLLENSSLNYYGFIEGDDIFKGTVDVVVCDGFVGNIALKTSEGVARMISHFMKEEFLRSPWNKMIGLMAKRILDNFRLRIDPRQYNGASFVGLQGIVVKSHGGADEFAFAQAIREAVVEIKKNVPERIRANLEALLIERPVS